MIKKINKEYLVNILIVILSIVPFIELDYLFENLIDVRISTIIKYLLIPLIVFILFLLYVEKKRKIIFIYSIYFLLIGIYFYFHNNNSITIYDSLFLTKNFKYVFKDEVIYLTTLILPIIYFYVFKKINITQNHLKLFSIITSVTISIPIFIGDIFLFGKSTYSGYTKGSIFAWFIKNNYNQFTRHPRFFASKFFFKEGNTIGILLVMSLIMLYYFLYKSNNKKSKILLTILIFIQNLSMIILSTRIATYGTIFVSIAMFLIYIILVVLKKEVLNKFYFSILIFMMLLSGVVLPFSPAVNNQKVESSDFVVLSLSDAKHKNYLKNNLAKGDKLIPGTKEYLDFYTHYFIDNIFLINVTPPVYYLKFYSYEHDPKFWVDFMFNYELFERINGRQLQKIFMDYKYQNIDFKTKFLGMGYSTFMNGSMLLEKDFSQQIYTLGYAGFILMVLFYLIKPAFVSIKLFLRYNDWNYYNIMLLFACLMGVSSAYISGHTLDQLITSVPIVLVLAMLSKNLKVKYEK